MMRWSIWTGLVVIFGLTGFNAVHSRDAVESETNFAPAIPVDKSDIEGCPLDPSGYPNATDLTHRECRCIVNGCCDCCLDVVLNYHIDHGSVWNVSRFLGHYVTCQTHQDVPPTLEPDYLRRIMVRLMAYPSTELQAGDNYVRPWPGCEPVPENNYCQVKLFDQILAIIKRLEGKKSSRRFFP